MQAVINPGNIQGTVTAPPSKSAMQRACAAALICGREVVLNNPGRSNDDCAALDIIQQLGATVTDDGKTIRIQSHGIKPVTSTINCGESGLSVRMFTPLAALAATPIHITGTGSLLSRPMDFFDEVLPQLGVSVSTSDGKLPLQVNGPLQPTDITIDGSVSSQFLTGLLMAYAAASEGGITIQVNNLKSRPYIDLTLKIMEGFGLPVPQNKNYESFFFPPGMPPAKTGRIVHDVEGDWSGAAFLMVAGAIAGSVTVTGIDAFTTQADKAILQALADTGCGLSIQADRVIVSTTPQLKPFHFNATDCPDLFPPLVALASFCNGTSVIEGIHRLAHKESDRGMTLQEEFGKMGVDISFQDDLMLVKGSTAINGAVVSSHHDHRIAMACAVAALRANGPVTINDAEAVNKSYPAFFTDLQQLGAGCSF